MGIGVTPMLANKAETLPKTLPGTVCAQWVRCGRWNCRCATGKLHGPYYYRLWRDGGKLRKTYVRRSEVDRVRARCEARRQFQRDLQAGWQGWRQMVAIVREAEKV
jgi:hypothetical protein